MRGWEPQDPARGPLPPCSPSPVEPGEAQPCWASTSQAALETRGSGETSCPVSGTHRQPRVGAHVPRTMVSHQEPVPQPHDMPLGTWVSQAGRAFRQYSPKMVRLTPPFWEDWRQDHVAKLFFRSCECVCCLQLLVWFGAGLSRRSWQLTGDPHAPGWLGAHPGQLSELLRWAGEEPAPRSHQISVSLQDHGEASQLSPAFHVWLWARFPPRQQRKPGPAAPHPHSSSTSPHPLLIRSPAHVYKPLGLPSPESSLTSLPTVSPSPPPSSSQHMPQTPCACVCECWSPWTVCARKMRAPYVAHRHLPDAQRCPWHMAVLWSVFVKYMETMPAWQIHLQSSVPALPSPADFLSVGFSVCVSFPGWFISVGTVMPCCGVSMRILKVGAHWGVPSSGCSMPPRVESLPRVWLLQARAQLMGTSLPSPPPITGSSPQAGECLASLARGYQTLVHRPVWPGTCSCERSASEHRCPLTHRLFPQLTAE